MLGDNYCPPEEVHIPNNTIGCLFPKTTSKPETFDQETCPTEERYHIPGVNRIFPTKNAAQAYLRDLLAERRPFC